MRIPFEKYHGTGNDFVLVDNRNHVIPEDADTIAQICHRRYGIGADGLILLGNSDDHDFSMRYFNADGHESSMCGNGGRCITAFARQLGIIQQECSFLAVDGTHQASIISEEGKISIVRLQMMDVEIGQWNEDDIFLDTGSPHLVKECSMIQSLDVMTEGRRIRHDERFAPGGTNVNFIEESSEGLNIRTYERGVESETLSCGTGVTAGALAWSLRKHIEGPIKVISMGGLLKVHFNRKEDHFTDIYLEGPAAHVFSGELDI